MNEEVKKTYEEIKALKIQGATNVALAAVDSLKGINKEEELEESIKNLSESRPTEPMMRSGLKYVKNKFKQGESTEEAVEEFKDLMEEIVQGIVETGANLVPEEARVMTHCHSSLVEKILIKAHKQGKLEGVVATETRPLYQGRKTARNLAQEGIEVVNCVDSARVHMLKDIDFCLVGADVITSDGHILNKIGTKAFALAAENMITRDFAVASQLLKLDPVTLKGKREKIEERSPEEVWENPPKGVEIRNPAFDAAPPENIDYVITEEGVLNPFDVVDNARRRYPWIFEGDK